MWREGLMTSVDQWAGPEPNEAGPLLFVAGERLGWVFRDRYTCRRQFSVPRPSFDDKRLRGLVEQTGRAPRRRPQRSVWASWLIGSLFAIFAIASYSDPVAGVPRGISIFFALCVLVGLPVRPLGWLIRMLRRGLALRAEAKATAQVAAWERERDLFDQVELARVEPMAEWGAARCAGRPARLDVVGGSGWGWAAFLTVFGASLLAGDERVTLVDLSGSEVGRELCGAAAQAGVPVRKRSPRELDLLAGLTPRRLVDVLVEAMYGGDPQPDREDRSIADRVLTEVCHALGERVTIGRLYGAVRVLMGEPGGTPELTTQERARIADELFSDRYLEQIHDRLRRIESALYPLRLLSSRIEEVDESARLDCLTVTADATNVRDELLTDLVVQWLAHRVADGPVSGTLIVAGADRLAVRNIARLAELCEFRRTRLVLLFRDLREESLQLVGKGPVAFMRLSSPRDATRAADLVGRQHKFVLSQVSRTVGGGTSRDRSRTRGGSVGGSGDQGTWSEDWSVTESFGKNTTWSEGNSQQRVYEYAVEPRTLQDLPEYAMLLVQSTRGGPVIVPVECNPGIIELDRVSMEPLPPAHPGALA